MQEAPSMNAGIREKLGSRYSRRYRGQGKLPAVVYGHGAAPLAVVLDAKEAITHITKGEKVFTLSIEGEKAGQTVLLKDLGFDYLGNNIIHADFARVDLNERVHTRVHVKLVGDPKGLKVAGNILMHPTNELDIECRVADIPDHLEVDISDLDVGHSISAAEVKLPKADMKMLTDSHAIVAQVVVQLEVKTDEAAVVGTAGGPEVLTAKKDEGAAAKGGAPAKGGAAAKAPAKEEKKK